MSLEEKPALGLVAEASFLRGGRGHFPADQLSLEEKPALGLVADDMRSRGWFDLPRGLPCMVRRWTLMGAQRSSTRS
jgi:hypothetical protein